MSQFAILRNNLDDFFESIVTLGKEWESKDRVVAKTDCGECEVSTVFFHKPLWFETMIFGGKRDGEQYRYETWEEAEANHWKLVKKLGGKYEPSTFLADLKTIK